MDVHTKEQRSKNMRAIKSSGTKQEMRLSKALWHLGYRFRKNDKCIFGKPDISIKKYKIAVFVDSEFFHGKDWEIEKHKIKSNQEFWHAKIERNIQRDIEVNSQLESEGWQVIRFWSNKIKKDIESCLKVIESSIHESKQNHFPL